MATPTYATDLADILVEFPNTTDWSALGGGASAMNAPEEDYFIQGANCISKNAWAGDLKGMIYDSGAGIVLPSSGAFFMWLNHLTPNSLADEADGGIQLLVGSSDTAFKQYYVEGADTNVFGGWTYAVASTAILANGTTGSPTANDQFFGGQANLPVGGPTKGAPFAIDAMRFGRGELRCIDGETSDFANFSGAEVYGDDVSRKWGLISLRQGAYYQSGLFIFGLAETAVDFRDSDKVVFVRDHPYVQPDFNTFEVRNSFSNVELTSIAFQAQGTTAPGRWLTTQEATVALTSCSFIDMGVFSFGTNTTADGCTFLRCDAITAEGANLSGSDISGSSVGTDESAVVWDVATDTDGLLDDTTFTKGDNAHHAIELGTNSPIEVTFTGITFSGFNASNGQDDSAIYVRRTTGTVTINAVGVTGTVSYKSDGAEVVVVINPVTLTVAVKDSVGAAIENARVLVLVDQGGPFPYQESVAITRSGVVAEVTHVDHGLSTNNKVLIAGSDQQEYNGVLTIEVTGTDIYTGTVSGSPDTPATGTIVSTAVLIEELTPSSGIVTDTRSYSADQPFSGRSRKGSASPLYKTATFSGTISKDSGLTSNVQMVDDE